MTPATDGVANGRFLLYRGVGCQSPSSALLPRSCMPFMGLVLLFEVGAVAATCWDQKDRWNKLPGVLL